MINLERIERRANAATEGPWGFSYGDRRYIADPSTDIVGEVAPSYSGQTMCVFAVASANQGDAEFIASARKDIPALIARVRELEAERDHERAEVERLREESATQADISSSTIARMKQQLREARAEVATAYRRGAEAMREACMDWCKSWENNGKAIAAALADVWIGDEDE